MDYYTVEVVTRSISPFEIMTVGFLTTVWLKIKTSSKNIKHFQRVAYQDLNAMLKIKIIQIVKWNNRIIISRILLLQQ